MRPSLGAVKENKLISAVPKNIIRDCAKLHLSSLRSPIEMDVRASVIYAINDQVRSQ